MKNKYYAERVTREDAGGELYAPVRYVNGEPQESGDTPTYDRAAVQRRCNQLNNPSRYWRRNNNFIHSLKRPEHAAMEYELLPMLGIQDGRLPDAGVPVQRIQGIPVWVTPKENKPHFIRTRALCPSCGREMAASRLIQHRCPD